MDNLIIKNIMKGSPPSKEYQVSLDNWRKHPFNKWAFVNTREIIPTSLIFSNEKKESEFQLDFNDLNNMEIIHKENKLILKNILKECQTDAFIILHRGKLIFEYFDYFTKKHTPHIVFSVSKSLTSLTVGILESKGVLDVNKNISYYIPEIKGSAYDTATIRNVLDMNVASNFIEDYLNPSGIFGEYRNATGWDKSDSLKNNEDGLRLFLSKMPESKLNHGEKYHYCSPHSDLLGWLIERTTGEKYSSVMSNLLFKPSGTIHDANVTLDKWGAPRSAGGISVSPYDLLLIAELVRCEGSNKNGQIIPSSWINDFKNYDNKFAYQNQDKLERFPNGNYRSKWYQTGFDDNEFCAIGIHGQNIWINPKKEITIVRMSSAIDPINIITEELMFSVFKEISKAL